MTGAWAGSGYILPVLVGYFCRWSGLNKMGLLADLISHIYFARLSVCLFVSNKRQNGWSNRAQVITVWQLHIRYIIIFDIQFIYYYYQGLFRTQWRYNRYKQRKDMNKKMNKQINVIIWPILTFIKRTQCLFASSNRPASVRNPPKIVRVQK